MTRIVILILISSLVFGCANPPRRWEVATSLSYQANPDFLPKDQAKVAVEYKLFSDAAPFKK